MYDRIGTHLSAALPDFSVNFCFRRISLKSEMLTKIIVDFANNAVGLTYVAFINGDSQLNLFGVVARVIGLSNRGMAD
jgi:hypothetical protein